MIRLIPTIRTADSENGINMRCAFGLKYPGLFATIERRYHLTFSNTKASGHTFVDKKLKAGRLLGCR
jgi:hypothetical protein